MTAATLNDSVVERGSVTIPRSGAWTAHLQVRSEAAITGAVTLRLGGLSLQGYVVSGGPYRGRCSLSLVGGSGGWRKAIPSRSYVDGAGVKLSTILTDAARECGESMGPMVLQRIGPAYVRPEGPAAASLETLLPQGWHVDTAGVTQVGLRASTTFADPYRIISRESARGTMTIAAESISGLMPGATLQDDTGSEWIVGSVRHDLTPDSLRSQIVRYEVGLTDSLAQAFRRLYAAFSRPTLFDGVYEYRLSSSDGGYADVVPASSSLGLPSLSNVPMRTGSPGAAGDPRIGSTVLIAFVNRDPCRPYVLAYEGESGSGYVPRLAKLDASDTLYLGPSASAVEAGGAGGYALRSGELIMLTGTFPPPGPATDLPFTIKLSTIPPTNAVVPGPPGTGRSKVKL